jgi:hypothetical protein
MYEEDTLDNLRGDELFYDHFERDHDEPYEPESDFDIDYTDVVDDERDDF